MRLALSVAAYLCGLAALVSAVVAGFQVMMGPANTGLADSSAAYTTASSTTVAASVPAPRSEPKRVEAIRPVNEPFQTPTPKYEMSSSSVPVSATAAYNKKKAKEKYAHRTVHRNSTPKISQEAANSFGWAGQNSEPQPRRPRDWTLY
jgi:hypothetical protein